jgi:hypothetical protein
MKVEMRNVNFKVGIYIAINMQYAIAGPIQRLKLVIFVAQQTILPQNVKLKEDAQSI